MAFPQNSFVSSGKIAGMASLLGALLLSQWLASPAAWAISPQSLERYQRGAQLERQGNLREAEQQFRQAITLDPEDPLNYIKLASVLTALGQPREAVSLYQQALQRDAKDRMLFFTLGNVYEQLGELPNAKRSYENGLNRNPDYKFGLLDLARVEAQMGEHQAAINHYQAFLQKYPAHFEARRYLAHLLSATGKPQEAVKVFEALKYEYPQRFRDHLAYARALNNADNPQMALEALKAAYAAEGDKADIAEETGNAHLALGQSNFAIQSYERALSLNPKKTELNLRIADLYDKQNKPAEAIPAYQRYLVNHPEDLGARQALAAAFLGVKDYRSGLQELLAVLEGTPADKANQRFPIIKQIGFAYQMMGDIPQAIKAYEAGIAMPMAAQDPDLKTNLALAYHQSGQLDKAVTLYRELYADPSRRSPALSKDLTNALVQLGDQAYKKGDFQLAQGLYQEAASYRNAENRDTTSVMGLANTFYAQQAFDKAYPLYEEVLSIAPGMPMARLYRDRIDVMRKQNLQRAVVDLEALVRELPADHWEVRLALAEAYLAVNQPVQAIASFESALTLQPDNPALLMQLGALYQGQNLPSKAVRAYETVIVKQPANALALYNVATLYQGAGQTDKALKAYQQALAADPTLADAYYGMATLFDMQQRYQEALNSYQAYTSQNPQGAYVQEAHSRIGLLENLLRQQDNPALRPATGTLSPENADQPSQPQTLLPAAGTSMMISPAATQPKAQPLQTQSRPTATTAADSPKPRPSVGASQPKVAPSTGKSAPKRLPQRPLTR